MKTRVPVLRKGEFPHSRGIVQVIDDAAIQSVLKQEIPPEGLLFDFDHYSDLTNDERTALSQTGIQLPSDASGWIHGFTMGDDGNTVYAEVDWTEKGEKAVKGGAYKYTSPVFPIANCEYIGGNRVRPRRISKVALTNEPNMKAIGAILANRGTLENSGGTDGDMDGPVYETAFGDGATDAPKQEKRNMHEKLNEALGLAKEASEESALEAVNALKEENAEAMEAVSKLRELKNRIEEQDAELQELRDAKAKAELDANVAAELAKYPNLPNREAAETLLRANFDAGNAFLATMPNTPAKSAPAANAGKGANPEDGASLKNREGQETPSERLERVRKASFAELKK